jgi:hypothetical protein
MAYLFGGGCLNSRLIIAFVGAAFGDRHTLFLQDLNALRLDPRNQAIW